MERNKEMQSFQARLHTFQIEHQLSKRRASSQQSKKKGGAHVVEWPHQSPAGEELARAGFFYRPAIDSEDNVQCFLCSVKLDGWEPEDDPIKEHLAHSASCNWAVSISVGHAASQAKTDEDQGALLQQQDPMSADLVAARRGTFEANGGEWPHESKKGWKCKITKMVEAGWCYDPAPQSDVEEGELDGVTCFYCNLSLDGWEPKDDPMKEHTKRSPDCAYFELVKMFGSEPGKKGKGKKGAARASTASKGSRLSTQSAVSQFSEVPSLADVGLSNEDVDMEAPAVDDSIVSTASQATATGAAKSKKGKGGRTKAPAKGAKGRERAGTVDSQAEAPLYPDLSSQVQSQRAEEVEAVLSQPPPAEEPAPAPAKKTRKAATRGSKAPQIDSSVVEISSLDLAPQPQTKPKRGRKPKAKPEPEPAPAEEPAELDDSEVSAQLQEELDRSLSIDSYARFEIEEQQASQPEKPKRGTKRTSDGLKKAQVQVDDSDVSATVMEFPAPPKATAPAAKAKKGRKASKQVEAEPVSQPAAATQEDVSMSDVEATKPAKGKKAPAKGKGKGKKASSTRSSRSSRATATEQEETQQEEEDLERDEREIEAELERIAAEQAKIQEEQDLAAEFEASPSTSRHPPPEKQPTRKASKQQQEEIKVVEDVAGSPPEASPVLHRENPTPSPTGSDKENDPSSAGLTKAKAASASQPQILLSPTKTTRIPLASGTPNRLLSPSKKQASPSKQISHITSTTPWHPIDLDDLLLASPQPTPMTLASRLVGVANAGGLASPEKGMSVEEWVRFQAGKAEEELKRKCEEIVGVFEREGLRALASLDGVEVIG